ncbi:MAG: GIY-YIG nuclease family protein [Limisphaerales bacterium]
MQFIDAVTQIIQDANSSLTPLEIREQLKIKHPQFYNTEAHRHDVEKGNYQSLDHALLAQVYRLARNSRFICDRSSRPMKLSISDLEEIQNEEETDFVSVEEVENNVGTIYIFKTGTFTQSGKEIFKIGITSCEIKQRIEQLFTTGVPYRFQIHKTYQISGFIELERSLHLLLARFRLNASREFFTEDAIPFVDRIIALHNEIKGA